MNLSSINYFIVLAKELSFTKAAERLHITQQSLSAHIAGLEREFGVRLLLRSVPLELTYAGRIYLQYAMEFQRRLDAMRHELNDVANNQRGLLKIGIAATRGRRILPALIEEFQRVYPQIDIRLLEESTDSLQQSLMDGEIDLAIANFPEELPGVELDDFYQEEVALLISRSLLQKLYGENAGQVLRTVAQGDLSPLETCPFLLNVQQDIAGRIGRSLLKRSGIILNPKLESATTGTILDICAKGVGACFCPDTLIKTALDEEQLAGIEMIRFGEDARYWIRFGYRRESYHWSVIKGFMDLGKRIIGRIKG